MQGDYRRRAFRHQPSLTGTHATLDRGDSPRCAGPGGASSRRPPANPPPCGGRGFLLLGFLAVLFRAGLAFRLARQLPALANARLFADLAAQVVEPPLADVTVAEDVDLVDTPRMH